MDPEDEVPIAGTSAHGASNQLKWRSSGRSARRAAKPYDRKPAPSSQQTQDDAPEVQSLVGRITSSVSSIIPSWLRGAASGFLLPIPRHEAEENTGDKNEDVNKEEDDEVDDDVDNDVENEGIAAPITNSPQTSSSDTTVLLNNSTSRRSVINQVLGDQPLSPFEPASQTRYPMTSTARKTKLTSSTASRLQQQLAKSKAKIQQRVDLELEDEVPDEASAAAAVVAGPSNPLIAGTANDCVDDDRSSTSENTASSTSGCSSLVPSHQDLNPLLSSQQQGSSNNNSSQNQSLLRQSKIQFPTDSIERLRLELLRKKQESSTSARTSVQSFDGPPSRPPSSISGHPIHGQQSGRSSSLWMPSTTAAAGGVVLRPLNDGQSGFGASFSRPGSSLQSQQSFSITARSPFYEGRTAYGGSSARRAARLVNSNPYARGVRIPPVLHVRVSDRSSGHEEHLSEAARKILQTMSSPLQEAKKIPLNESQGLSNRMAFQSYTRPAPSVLTSSGISTSILNRSNVPAAAVRDQSYRMNWPIDLKDFVDKNKQRQQVPSHENSDKVDSVRVSSVDAPVSSGGKMKSSLSSARLAMREERDGSSGETLSSLSEATGLPDVSLPPLKKLPKFNLTSNNRSSCQSVPRSDTSSLRPSLSSSSPSSSIVADAGVESTVTSISSTAISEFPFSSPAPHTSHRSIAPTKSVPKSDVNVKAAVTLFEKSSATKSAAFGSFAGTKSSPQIKSDAIVAVTSFAPEHNSTPKSKSEPQTDCWSCKSCMLSNPVAKDSCAACQEPRFASANSFGFRSDKSPAPVATISPPVPPPPKEVTADDKPQEKVKSLPIVQPFKFAAAPAGSWSCPICMIRNSPDRNICAACEAVKPNPAPQQSSPIVKKDTFQLPVPTTIAVAKPTPEVKTAAPKESDAFVGGTPAVSSSTPIFGSTTPSFSFGLTSAVTTTTAPLTFASIPSAGSTSGPFSFGTNAGTSTATTSSTLPATPAFKFGSPAPSVTFDSAPAVATISTSTPAVTQSSFTFGTKAQKPAASTTSAVPAFIFAGSGPAVTTTAESKPNSFAFGSAASTQPPAQSTFAFGAKSDSPAVVPTSAPVAPAFSFAAAAAPAPATPQSKPSTFSFGSAASMQPPAQSPFAFGNRSEPSTAGSTSAAVAPAFSFAAAAAPASATLQSKPSPFAFGSKSEPSTGGVTSAPIAPTFNFAAVASPAPATPLSKPSPFAFGTKSAPLPVVPTSAPVPPTFNFAATATPAPATPQSNQSNFMFGSMASSPFASSGFNFGAAPSTPAQGIGAPSQSMGTPFSFTADASDGGGGSGLGSGATAERRIRKAKRRLK